MRRIKQPILKFGIIVGYPLLAFLFYRLGVRCLFRTLLHIPCPGCGMTRAVVSLLHLEFPTAFSYHPMVFALPVMVLYFLLDGKLLGKKWDTAVWIFLGLGFAAHWLQLLLA